MSQIVQKCSDTINVSGNMVSCFQVGSKNIICFYIHSLNPKQYKIIIYNEYLVKSGDGTDIYPNLMDENIFFKGIHYEAETGFFFILMKLVKRGLIQ